MNAIYERLMNDDYLDRDVYFGSDSNSDSESDIGDDAEPCLICGCTRACDQFGDRLCGCDACKAHGCMPNMVTPIQTPERWGSIACLCGDCAPATAAATRMRRPSSSSSHCGGGGCVERASLTFHGAACEDPRGHTIVSVVDRRSGHSCGVASEGLSDSRPRRDLLADDETAMQVVEVLTASYTTYSRCAPMVISYDEHDVAKKHSGWRADGWNYPGWDRQNENGARQTAPLQVYPCGDSYEDDIWCLTLWAQSFKMSQDRFALRIYLPAASMASAIYHGGGLPPACLMRAAAEQTLGCGIRLPEMRFGSLAMHCAVAVIAAVPRSPLPEALPEFPELALVNENAALVNENAALKAELAALRAARAA